MNRGLRVAIARKVNDLLETECFAYRLGNRSALEWVIDQYQVSQEKRSWIVSDPNNPDDEEYIVRLVAKVITVSMETVRLVNELAQVVTQEDWMNSLQFKHAENITRPLQSAIFGHVE